MHPKLKQAKAALEKLPAKEQDRWGLFLLTWLSLREGESEDVSPDFLDRVNEILLLPQEDQTYYAGILQSELIEWRKYEEEGIYYGWTMEELREAIQKGIDSGPAEPWDTETFLREARAYWAKKQDRRHPGDS